MAPPLTRASLLVRLRDPRDTVAWSQFVALYAPVLYGFARKRGLQDADAADLMQEVLRSVSGAVGRLDYDPQRGSFRSWLYTIARNKVNSFYEGQKRQFRASGDSQTRELLEGQAAPPDEMAAVWRQEYEWRAFAWAVEQIRDEFQESTWKAFWLTAVDGLSVKEVGDRLKLSPGAVYVARSRVISRLRERIQELDGE